MSYLSKAFARLDVAAAAIQKGAQPRDTAIRHATAITTIAAIVAQTICFLQRFVKAASRQFRSGFAISDSREDLVWRNPSMSQNIKAGRADQFSGRGAPDSCLSSRLPLQPLLSELLRIRHCLLGGREDRQFSVRGFRVITDLRENDLGGEGSVADRARRAVGAITAIQKYCTHLICQKMQAGILA